jgi:hypothetical protein
MVVSVKADVLEIPLSLHFDELLPLLADLIIELCLIGLELDNRGTEALDATVRRTVCFVAPSASSRR